MIAVPFTQASIAANRFGFGARPGELAAAGSDPRGRLNCVLGALADRSVEGLALGQNVPLILRGPMPVGSWAPSRLPEADSELIAHLRDLYLDDATLSARLDEGTRT